MAADEQPADPPTHEELLELARVADHAIENFKGHSHTLEGAIGMLFVGRRYGWRVLYLIHDRKTVRKYERVLGINAQEFFPALGDRRRKSVAYLAAEKVGNFWKAVRGEIKDVKTPEVR